MPQEEKLKTLHTNLTNKVEGFEVDYDTFKKDMQDDTKRKTLHSNMPKYFEGFEVDYDTFSNDMGVKKKASSEDVGQDYQDVLKSVSQKGSDAVSVLPSAIENLESMPQWAREKILNRKPEIIKPVEFGREDYMVSQKQKMEKGIPDMFDQERKKNTKLILSKPSELDVIKDSSVGGIIQGVDGNFVEYSPDKSDVSFWKNIDLTDVPSISVNFGNTDEPRVMGNVTMPLPIKKMVDDYLYYLDKNEPKEFEKYDKDNLTDEERANIILQAANHQQDKIKAESDAKKFKGGALNLLDSHIAEGWEWNEDDARLASEKIKDITEDYLYRSDNKISAAYKNAELREIDKKYEQKITDAQYDAYAERGGFAADPLKGFYYNIVQPVGTRGQDAVRGIMTLPRAVGLDEVAPELFGKIVNDADKFFTPTETETPTKLKADLLGKDGFNFTALVPKLAGALTDFGLLMVGTKGLTGAGLSSKSSLLASSFAHTNDNYFNEGIDAGLTKGQATLYGDIAAMATSVLELVSPNTGLLTGFKKEVTPLVLKDVAEGKAVKESFESRMKGYLKEVGKEELQEFSQLVTDKALNYATNQELNSNLNTEITQNEIFETAVLTFATSGIANMARLKPVSDFNSSAVYSLSMMDDAKREETIRGGMERGTITPQQGQELIDGTNEIRRVLAGLPEGKYSAKQQMDLAGLIYQKQLEEKGQKEIIVDSNFEQDQPKTVEKINEEIKLTKEKYDSENKEVTNKLKIDEKATEAEGREEGLLSTEEISPSEEGEVPIEESRPTDEVESVKWDEKVISKLDKWEKNLKDFSKGTLGINVPVVVGSGAIKAMKLVVKSAATIQDIIQAGIDHVKSTEWYQKLDQNQRNEVDEQLEHDFNINISEQQPTVKEKKKRRETKAFYQGVSEGIKKGIEETTDTQKDLSTQIRDVLKKPSIITKLSLPQYRALVNEARNVTTPEQLETYKNTVADILEKQSEENIQKKKKSQANKNKSKIKKLAKSSNTLANDKSVLKEFGKINTNQVEDIDEYNRISEQLLNKDNRTISNKEIEKYIAKQKKTSDEIRKKDLLKQNDDLIESGVINDKMDLKEIQETLEGYRTTVTGEIQQEQKLEERAERKKEKRAEIQGLIDEKLIQLNEEIKDEELSENKNEVISALNKIDRTDLKDETLQLINRVIDNIIVNDSYARSGEIVIAFKVQEAIREYGFELKQLGYDSLEQFLSDTTEGLEKAMKEAQKKILSISQFESAIELHNKLKGLTAYVTGIQDLKSGHSKVIKRMDVFDKKFTAKQNENNRGFLSQIRQAMYSMVSQNYGGNQEDIDSEFQTNKKRLSQSAKRSAIDVIESIYNKYEHNRKSKKRISLEEKNELIKKINSSKDASKLAVELKEKFPINQYKKADFSELEIYTDLIENANTSEEVLSKLNKDEVDMIKFLREEYKSIQEDLFETSEIYGDEVPELVENYLPLVYTKMKGESNIKTEKDINQELESNQFLGDVINKAKSRTTIGRDKDSYIKEGMKLSTNFHYDMNRKFREALYQIHTLESRKTIGRVLGNNKFRDIFGKGNAEQLHKYVVDGIKSQLNLAESDPSWLAVAGSFTKLASAGTRIALGSWVFGRINQMVNVQIGAAIRIGNGGFARVPSKPNENLFKHSNIEEAIITKSGFKQDYYIKDQQVTNELNKLKKIYREVVGKKDAAVEWLDNAALSEMGKGDAIARQKTWMRYYRSYRMKRDGVKKINWKKEAENPSKRASSYADQNIEETQSGNSFSALAPILIKKRNWGALLQKMYLGFQTFAITMRARLSVAFRKLRKARMLSSSRDTELAKEAFTEFASVMAESATFAAIKAAQGALLIWVGREGLKALFGFSDDEAEELMPQITLNDFLKRAGGNVFKDLFITGIPLADAPANEFLNWSWKSMTGDKRNLFYQKNLEDTGWWESFGAYAPAIGAWYNFGSDIKALMYGVPNLEKGGLESKSIVDTRELTDKERDFYYLLLAFDTAKLLGFSDQSISTITNKYRRIVEKSYEIGEAKLLFDPNKKKNDSDSRSGRSRSTRTNSRRITGR